MKETLASFVENKEIGAWIIAAIWDNKNRTLADTDAIQQVAFHVVDVWALCVICKTLVVALPAGLYLKTCKTEMNAAINN